jgi:hypothetical protein
MRLEDDALDEALEHVVFSRSQRLGEKNQRRDRRLQFMGGVNNEVRTERFAADRRIEVRGLARCDGL